MGKYFPQSKIIFNLRHYTDTSVLKLQHRIVKIRRFMQCHST